MTTRDAAGDATAVTSADGSDVPIVPWPPAVAPRRDTRTLPARATAPRGRRRDTGRLRMIGSRQAIGRDM